MNLQQITNRLLSKYLPNKVWKELCYRSEYNKLMKGNIGEALRANKALEGIYNGQRCFILGNGPSLKEIDLSLLADEITFTVNDLFYKEDFSKLQTTYHVLADPFYFDELKSILQKLYDKSSPHAVFIESCGFHKMKQQNLDMRYPIYVYHNGIEVEDMSFMDIDPCHMLPYFCTVVQSAVLIAAYMGFHEIYLLGCDCTGIMNYINKFQGQKVAQYAFELPDDERKKQSNVTITSEHMFFEWYHIFKSYRLLRKYLERCSIKLINLTPNSILDSLEKGNLKDVIKT